MTDVPANLELVETDVLLAELFHRYDVAGFVAMKCNAHGAGSHEYHRKWMGNSHTVAGLCLDLADTAIREVHVNSQPAGEDE